MHAPDSFELDDEGLSVVTNSTTADTVAAQRAQDNCPERAITVKEM